MVFFGFRVHCKNVDTLKSFDMWMQHFASFLDSNVLFHDSSVDTLVGRSTPSCNAYVVSWEWNYNIHMIPVYLILLFGVFDFFFDINSFIMWSVYVVSFVAMFMTRPLFWFLLLQFRTEKKFKGVRFNSL